MAPSNLPIAAAATTLFCLSHAFDFPYLSGHVIMTLRMLLMQKNKQLLGTSSSSSNDSEAAIQTAAAHRFLQWFVTTNHVSTRDLDFNFHMSNSRYSRHADHARNKLLMATGFVRALQVLRCGLVLSAISQKFRREIGFNQKYHVYVRIAGWDERHFYVEHVFLMEKESGAAGGSITTTRRQEEDERIRQQSALDGSSEAVQRVVDLQTRNFHQATGTASTQGMAQQFIVASILTVRMTTTRNRSGSVVTPSQVIHQMGLSDALPSVAPPPLDIQEWTKTVEMNSDRYTKKQGQHSTTDTTQNPVLLRSKL